MAKKGTPLKQSGYSGNQNKLSTRYSGDSPSKRSVSRRGSAKSVKPLPGTK